jgi:alpha 1,2-mannosyltransferase
MGWIRRYQTTRIRRFLVTAASALLLIVFINRCGHFSPLLNGTRLHLLGYSRASGANHILSPEVQQYWRILRDHLYQLAPDVEPILMEKKATLVDEKVDLQKEPSHARLDLIALPRQTVEALQTTHDAMLNLSKVLAPNLPYKKFSRGIVTTAGGKYFNIVIVSLRMLRRSGSQLPVVVFLDTFADYDWLVCEELFPSLNAECVVLSNLLDDSPPSIALQTYQYKIFALLFSPFQEMLFMDADAFPALNPDQLFVDEPYTSTGLVTWPDFWVSTASPLLYEITRLDMPAVTERRSSEAGMLLYDKARHGPDLLLSLFYNHFGPRWYYPLMSQGGQGEGDKETFLHAAMVAGASWYDVKSPVTVMGRWINGTWHSTGMKQADPRVDWAMSLSTEERSSNPRLRSIERKLEHGGEKSKDLNMAMTGRPFFIHNNIVKLDMEKLVQPGSPLLERNEAGRWQRLWGPRKLLIDEFGYDVESVLWEELVAVACQLLTTRDCRMVMKIAEDLSA